MQKRTPAAKSPPPRVEISYEIEVGEQTERRELPFVIGVLADLSGDLSEPPVRLRNRKFVQVDADNFDRILDKLAPRLSLKVRNKLSGPDDGGQIRAELRFRAMRDFSPVAVAEQISPLKALLELRGRLNNLRALLWANNRLDDLIRDFVLTRRTEKQTQTPDALVQDLVEQGRFGRFAEDNDAAADLLLPFIKELDAGQIVRSPTIDAMLSARIAAVDRILSAQLNEVFHHPQFQRLEAAWRGLEYLVRSTVTSSILKIRVLSVTKDEIARDQMRAVEFDQSDMFRLVYDEEYGMPGGEPYAALIADYVFDQGPKDVEILERIARIAATASMPFIAPTAPGMFNLDSFRDLSMPRDLSKIFENITYTKWKAFRESDDARYVALVLPRVLQRLPYGREGLAAEGFDYDEGVDGSDPEKFLWGNAAYAFAARLTDAFARYGWCVAISGMECGGVVSGLPMQSFVSDDGDTIVTCPTEIAITDRRRDELQRLGFIPLCYEKRTDRAVFFEAHSCYKPPLYVDPRRSDAIAELSSLEYVFAISRFAHYLKAITRDKGRTIQGRREWERYLNNWLAEYVLLDEDAEPDVKARYPLCEGRVTVEEVPGYPGRFQVSAQLRPHYQITPPAIGIPETVATIKLGMRANRYGG